MTVTIVNVSRNSFENEKGREVKYCKFSVLTPSENRDNFVGFDLVSYTTKYENYDFISKIVKTGKSVNLELSFSKLANGYYRAKPIKIDETDL